MGLKKLGKWVKKNIKPIATVAAILYPPLIPMIGNALVPASMVGGAAAAAERHRQGAECTSLRGFCRRDPGGDV